MKLPATINRIKLMSALILFAASTAGLKAQVTIGSNTPPNSNAVLDLVSNANKGLLLPRVALTSTTSASPLSTHVAGMLVYNTAISGSGATTVYPGIYCNDGSAWISTIVSSTNIYNGDGTLAGNRVVTMDGKTLGFNGGNVGIGTAAPVYKLDVVGRGRFQAGNGDAAGFWLTNNAGSLDRAFIGMSSDTTVGMWGNNGANWSLNMNVTSGNVGIGTATPADRLHIFGHNSKLIIDNGTGQTSEIGIVFKNGDMTGSEPKSAIISKGYNNWKRADMYFVLDGAGDAGPYDLSTDTKMIIKAETGNVGIGTTTPSAKLEVNGQLKITGGAPGAGKVLTSDANGLASWKDPYTSNCENSISTIYSTGVIINVPNNSKYIYANVTATTWCYGASASAKFYLDVSNAKMIPISNNVNSANDTTLYYSVSGLGDVTLRYSPTAKTIMAIDNGTACGGGIFNWGLNGCWSENYDPGSYILTAWSLNGNAISASQFIGTKNNSDLVFKTNNIETMRLTKGGNLGIGTANPNYKLHVNGDVGAYTYNCISDIRLKKDIKPLEVDNNQVLRIRPVTYILKEDPQQLPRMGVIAQELEMLFPNLVKTDQNGYKAVEYDKISLLLLSVVKQQQKDIEQVKAQLKKLEEKVK